MSTVLAGKLLPLSSTRSAQPFAEDMFDQIAGFRGAEMALDLLAGALSLTLSSALLKSFGLTLFPGSLRHVGWACAFFLCLLLLALHRSGTYRISGGLLGLRESACVLQAVASLYLVLVPCAIIFGSRTLVLGALVEAPILTFLLLIRKHLFDKCLRHLPAHMLQRVLIHGPHASANMVFAALVRCSTLRMSPVAIVAEDPHAPNFTCHASGYRRTHSMRSDGGALTAAKIRGHRADVVLVTEPFATQEAFQQIVEETSLGGARLLLRAAHPFEGHVQALDYIDFDGQLIYGVARPRLARMHDIVARALDVVISGAALVVLLPVLCIVALLVRLDSPGPIIFSQLRVGRGEQTFTMFKFRTMYHQTCGSGMSPSHASDPRITKLGRLLRKTSLDELPQLWNVLRGDMALVGPRPEMPFIVQGYTPTQRERLAVRPGLSGIWQLSVDRCRPIHENVHYDLYYVRHRSTSLDIAILLHTFLFAMRGT